MTSSEPRHAALLRRWDRIGLGLRLAYNPTLPCVIQQYQEAGRRVVAAGALPELAVQRRQLTVLLQTAHDEALPWFWRSVCLEYSTLPLARLQSLLKHDDPVACDALFCAVQSARDLLSATRLRAVRGLRDSEV